MSNSTKAGECWLFKGIIKKLFLPQLEHKQNTAELSHFLFNKLSLLLKWNVANISFG